MKKLLIILGIVVVVGAIWLAESRLNLFQKPVAPGEVVTVPDSDSSTEEQTPSATSTSPLTPPPSPSSERRGPESPVSYVVEEVVSGLTVPWSIVWTSPERMLVAERPGRLRVVVNGQLQKEPLITFEDVTHRGEAGLMGLTLDPNYQNNQWLYACYAYTKKGELTGRVVRLKDDGNKATVDKIIIDDITSAQYHAGCRVAFGSDGKLYITTGDATEKNLAQDLKSLAGKILRLNSDGSIPSDNPFSNSPIWSYGHRNPQGIAWHPLTGEMYETEHGPSGFDGPGGGDEVNRIVKGGNYGWPLVSHEKRREGTIAPLVIYTPAEAPASLLVYSGNALPQFKNNLFFGALRGEGLMRLVLDDKNPDKIISYEKLKEVRFGRIRAVAGSPDGFIYFSTSNRDGRGSPAQSDDRIFRIRPK